ncbi:MAG: DUF2505 domain-containing protein [Mycobacterium sp.]|jgi:hypothetical protein
MPRSYDLAADYGCSVALVHGAFADKTYWLERLEASGCDAATLDYLAIGEDGCLDIATTQTVSSSRLPGLIRQLRAGDLTLIRAESWSPVRDGRAAGTITGTAPGAPVNFSGKAVLSTTDAGTHLDVHATVEVRIPLVGGKAEEFIGGQLAEMVRLEQEFTSAWITDRA